jgi:hypothetical protein
MGGEVSTQGDVYNYEIFVLEMSQERDLPTKCLKMVSTFITLLI